MKDVLQEHQPASVAQWPRQAGDIRARWAWVEAAVWTDRMLTALEQGVKGGVWFSLMDKVSSTRGLAASWERVKANRGSGLANLSKKRSARKPEETTAGAWTKSSPG